MSTRRSVLKAVGASGFVTLSSLAVVPGSRATEANPPEDGFLPDEAEGDGQTEPDGVQPDAEPVEGEWTLARHDAEEAITPDIDKVYVQHDPTAIYFKITFSGDLSQRNDINTAVFIDADQNSETGLTSGQEGYYYLDGIGADYAVIVGEEGDGLWKWDGAWNQNHTSLAYSDFRYADDEVVFGVTRSVIDDPETFDYIVTNATTSPWDYVPNQNNGHLTYSFDDQTGPSALPGFDTAPTDPDGDGLYEDINGDGEVDISDVQALFEHFDDPEVQDDAAYFDFNDDGKLDITDVQHLFKNL